MVITLDKHKKPLAHCTEKRARQLISKGRACVYSYFPFTIILKDIDRRTLGRVETIHKTDYGPTPHRYRIKIDPGAKHTGITVIHKDKVILFMQIEHRGGSVVNNLKTRHDARRNRRSRETPYRHPKFGKGGQFDTPRPKGWLPPSQISIADNVINWVRRLECWLGPCDVDIEGVKFDTQLMENPDIQVVEYQHGTLFGYEVRNYLMEKYQHTCQYCTGKSKDPVLEWEHMIPKSRGGTDTIKNATLACRKCNQDKGSLKPEEWLSKLRSKKRKTELDDKRIVCLERVIQGKANGTNLRYAAWSNIIRWYLRKGIESLTLTGNVKWYTGGRTAYNRSKHNVAKDHHLDAMCVGYMPANGYRNTNQKVLYVKAMGRGSRLLGQINNCGIIINKWHDHHKRVNGLQTGDIVRVDIPNGKYKGVHTGRVKVRSSGSHDVVCANNKTVTGTKQSIYKVLQRIDGYKYQYEKPVKQGAIPHVY